ncbi:probable cationic amino acid transporter [Haliotis rufescens]|uniref:probable cationic amino acid transporter n=1 Tax=Haliotis rufescens TaxID=6454 RepID=UPI00201F8DDB|nr:probable cationic amino acid transporter [Haliotis rufescens]XP_046362062.2 probable cationic amino acid transporter [Haliotis rufescens]XP_046362063.2 probable cationic amino acid transporter [Haliotis rufescens]
MAYVQPFLRRATRRRPAAQDGEELSKCPNQEDGLAEEGFKKCLTTFDLVSLGVGSCCGAGMYLTVGLVSRGAGIGGALSFIIAGFGSLLSGLCYAELAALCPKTSGSAYMYSYVTVGELVAFVIGWGLLVEYAIGTAASAVALSAAVDTMSNYSYGKVMTTYVGAFLGRPYFDVIAAVVCLALTLVLTSGVKLSATFNNILNLVNLIVLLIFCGCSILLIRPMIVEDNGIFPNGVSGAIAQIPTAYFAFIGFDIVASTGEEAMNPSKSIPRSIWVSVFINTIVYVAVVIFLNLAMPYFAMTSNSAMIDVFATKQWTYVTYIVSTGAVCALFAATFGSLFPLPRVLYAMAKDGLISSHFGYLCPTRKTPKLATVVSGCISAVVAVSVDLRLLIEMVLIGTLLAYVLVAVCVLITRYSFDEDNISNLPSKDTNDNPEKSGQDKMSEILSNGSKVEPDMHLPLSRKLWKLFSRSPTPGETLTSGELSVILVTLLGAETIASLVLVTFGDVIADGNIFVCTCLSPFVLAVLVVIMILCRLPQNTRTSGFRVPLVPLLPVAVTFFNVYLMMSLRWVTWCMFGVWMIIGFLVYLFYSQRDGGPQVSSVDEDKRPLLEAKDSKDEDP